MPRRKHQSSQKSGVARLCAICGERAIGKNFGEAYSCMSCKAFFRRHALKTKEVLRCPFFERCHIDQVTRRFCAFCRLKRCFEAGMKTERILTEEQRREMREKIHRNRLLREAKKQQQSQSKRRRQYSEHSSDSFSSSSAISSPSGSATEEPVNSITVEYIVNDPCSISVLEDDPYYPSLLTSDYSPEELERARVDTLWDDYCSQLFYEDISFRSLGAETEEEEPIFEDTSLESHEMTLDISLFSPEEVSSFPDTDSYALCSTSSSASSDFLFDYFHHLTPLSTDNVAGHLTGSYLTPTQELSPAEKRLLQEVSSACTILANSYTRIEFLDVYDGARTSQLSWALFNRLTTMCGRLEAFRKLSEEDQKRVRRGALFEMAAIRSVLMYDEFRDAWCVVDDKRQTSVFIKLDHFRHFCTHHSIERHKAFPRLFRDEWKRDSLIINLLTVLVLFTPKPEYSDVKEITESHQLYDRLLQRYLSFIYNNDENNSNDEAEECYRKLMENLEEMRILNLDVQHFYRSIGNQLTAF